MFARRSKWARGLKRLHAHARWMVVRKQGFGVEMVFQNDAQTASSVGVACPAGGNGFMYWK